ncbi:MAG: SpoIIE family protein phosphatase [Nitrospirae bacterium]|nr:SpoIIE family protein phosphatase [Nitrospirota bacterium]
MNESNLDLSKPVEISEKIYWVGVAVENDPFKCHPYLLIDNDEAILFDIGTLENHDKILTKVKSLIDLKNVTHIVLHHQDPDLCAGVTEWERLIGKEIKIVTHTRTTFLLKHYGIKSEYYCVDDHDFTLKLRSGRVLQFVFTPYLHFPGAIATYDKKTKTLFSSDIFGGVSDKWSFYADEGYFEQIKGFHEAYMPSREILVYGMRQFEKLDIEIIAPQHGSIIKRNYIKGLIAQMKNLNCGLFIEQEYYNELKEAEEKLKEAYNIIKKDLQSAGDLQKKMLPNPSTIVGYKFNWIFEPSSFIGGDAFNYFRLNGRYIGFYLLDVTGHGIPAALLSFTASKTISPHGETSPLTKQAIDGFDVLMPSKAVEEINKRFQREKGTTQYFTMVYGIIDIQTNGIKLIRAGHAMPIYQPKNGNPVFLEKGGLPIGLIPNIDYKDEEELTMSEGDRLFIYSDGISECFNSKNEQFSGERLIEYFKENKTMPLDELLKNLKEILIKWRGGDNFDDDVSMVAIEKIEAKE